MVEVPVQRRDLRDLVIPDFEPNQGVTVEVWLARLARAVEGLNSLSFTPWSERELYYATIPKLTGEVSIWISMDHETSRDEDKSYGK